MNSLEEMKRLVAIRYLHNIEKANNTLNKETEKAYRLFALEDTNFLRLLDEKFACCENKEQERIRAEEIKEGAL